LVELTLLDIGRTDSARHCCVIIVPGECVIGRIDIGTTLLDIDRVDIARIWCVISVPGECDIGRIDIARHCCVIIVVIMYRTGTPPSPGMCIDL
jgi:hypothetical protein